MTSFLGKDCGKSVYGFSTYQCASGICVMMSGACRRSSKCPSYSRGYYCPDTGWCESADYRCLRACGFNQSSFIYKYNCPGYPGLCASRSYYCPPDCSAHGETYKCLKQRKCARGENWCESCFAQHRCQDDGKCISYSKKCDKYNDCSDGEDELSCSYHDYDNIGMDEWQLAGLVLGIFMVFFLFFYCCWKRAKSSASEESTARTQSTGQNRQITSGGPRLTGTTPAVIRPPAVSVRNAYAPHPSNNTTMSNPPSEAGFYSPRGLPVVSGAQGGYPAAASAPGSYPEAANAMSPEENQTIGPPPSYFDAIQNAEMQEPKDPMLPSYEEAIEGTPTDKQSFT